MEIQLDQRHSSVEMVAQGLKQRGVGSGVVKGLAVAVDGTDALQGEQEGGGPGGVVELFRDDSSERSAFLGGGALTC